MTLPIYAFIKDCGQFKKPSQLSLQGKLDGQGKAVLCLTGLDIFLSVTALVVGVLTLLNIIPIPSFLAYMPPHCLFFAFSGGITLLWISLLIASKGKVFSQIKDILPGMSCKSCCCNPAYSSSAEI